MSGLIIDNHPHKTSILFSVASQRRRIPYLSQVAYDLLSIPAISDENESVFSETKSFSEIVGMPGYHVGGSQRDASGTGAQP
jgi:hAT family C-terminal dimerisation region